jgi:hypothetical protein
MHDDSVMSGRIAPLGGLASRREIFLDHQVCNGFPSN